MASSVTTVQRASASVGLPPASRGVRARVIWWRRAAPDTAGILLVVGAAVVVMLPALLHGTALGPYDLLSRYGLTAHPGVRVHNAQTTDQIAQMIPWTSVAWTQVHHGQLPLWNPYSLLGMPLAFNWQSSVFSVPALFSYLVPLHLAYTVQVMMTLLIAGTGMYVLVRVLRLHLVSCVMAAVVYELSGAFMGVLGWPIATVMAWGGWVFAAIVLVVRGRRRLAAGAFVALTGACAVYAGQPDALVLLGMGAVVFAVVLAVAHSRHAQHASALRPLGDLVVGGVAAAALSAPLLLPGTQLVSGSVFAHSPKANGAVPLNDLVNLAFQGFNGLSVAKGQWFAIGSTAYVGVIVLVLALMGAALRWRRPEVLALTVTGAIMGALVYLSPVAALAGQLPFRARWHLGLVVVTLALAALAGVGTDVVVDGPRDFATRAWLASGFGVGALVIAALWVLGRGHLAPAAARLRDQSFAWPAACVVLGLSVAALLSIRARPRANAPGRPRPEDSGRGRAWRLPAGATAAVVMVAAESAFLLGVGVPVWSSSPAYLATPAPVRVLQRSVGTSLVAFGTPSCELPPTVGILPEANAAFGVHELSAYDPVIPKAFYRALHVGLGVPVSAFCPVVRSATEARRLGVQYVLVARGAPRPAGTLLDRAVGDEVLYEVPGAAAATLVPLAPGAAQPGPDVPGEPVPVEHPDPATWKLHTAGVVPKLLRLRLSDVPGWRATVDGRTVPVGRFDGLMLELRVPPGTHTVVLRYWPRSFSVGLVLALCALGVAVLVIAFTWLRRLRSRGRARNTATPPAPA